MNIYNFSQLTRFNSLEIALNDVQIGDIIEFSKLRIELTQHKWWWTYLWPNAQKRANELGPGSGPIVWVADEATQHGSFMDKHYLVFMDKQPSEAAIRAIKTDLTHIHFKNKAFALLPHHPEYMFHELPVPNNDHCLQCYDNSTATATKFTEHEED